MRLSGDEPNISTELINTLFGGQASEEFVRWVVDHMMCAEAIDFIAAINGLRLLTPIDTAKIIKDSGSSILRYIAEDGSRKQMDLEKFARYLPRHLLAVICAWEWDKSTMNYLLFGILLLHSMFDIAPRVPKIEQVLLEDMSVLEQLIDLVSYLLITLGAPRQEIVDISDDVILVHPAMVSCTLKLLTASISPHFQELAQVLVVYRKVDMLMDAALSAVWIDVSSLQIKLSAELDKSCARTSPTEEGITLNSLCGQCDSSLQFLQSLCQQKLIRELMVKNKELCSNGGVLKLVQAVVNLKMVPLHTATSSSMAAISRLKSTALSILLYLCDESGSYLDEVFSNPGCQHLAQSIALKVLELLKEMFGMDSKQLTASSTRIYPRGQLELNAMRLTDVFSDDSNFRPFITINFTEVLAATILLPHGEFLSNWCSSDLPVSEDNDTLDVPRESYAHQRTSLLIKVIANLHCFIPDVCQDEKDLFLNKFVRFVKKELETQSGGLTSAFDAERTTTVSKNLCSLLSHAESLIPGFLNEDDVQLLRLFTSQVESLIVPASENHIVQNAQNSGVQSSPLQRELAPQFDTDDVNMEEGTLENGVYQKLNHLDVSRNGNDQSNNGEKKSGITEHGESSVAPVKLRMEGDAQTVENSGSDSSPTQGKNSLDRMDVDHIKGRAFEETPEDEKVDAIHSDDKHPRRRKRTMMNDKQIALIEAALVDEPDMHRNSNSLRVWAERLSLHGAEVATSRLKNWLNNRKARLARVAKDVRTPSAGDNLDRQVGPGQLDSPQSPMDDAPVPSGARVSLTTEVSVTALAANANKDSGTLLSTPTGVVRSGLYFEPGQHVMLVNDKAEIAKGKIFQVRGNWYGSNLDQSGMCVVDIAELLVDRSNKLLYPTEATGDSFYEAEMRLGVMRVLWDLNKVFQLPPL